MAKTIRLKVTTTTVELPITWQTLSNQTFRAPVVSSSAPEGNCQVDVSCDAVRSDCEKSKTPISSA